MSYEYRYTPKNKQRYYFKGAKVQKKLQINEFSIEKDGQTLTERHDFNQNGHDSNARNAGFRT